MGGDSLVSPAGRKGLLYSRRPGVLLFFDLETKQVPDAVTCERETVDNSWFESEFLCCLNCGAANGGGVSGKHHASPFCSRAAYALNYEVLYIPRTTK
jgi:hypothetical protein